MAQDVKSYDTCFFHSDCFYVKIFICVFVCFVFALEQYFFLYSCYLNRKRWCDFYQHQQAYACDNHVTSEMMNVDCCPVMLQMHFATRHFFK